MHPPSAGYSDGSFAPLDSSGNEILDTSHRGGAGLLIIGDGNVTIDGANIYDNVVDGIFQEEGTDDYPGWGGGLLVDAGDVKISNTDIFRNIATEVGSLSMRDRRFGHVAPIR